MTDLSVPPLSLVTLNLADPVVPEDEAPPARPGFAWPTPREPGYGLPEPLTAPEPAELEGPNGKLTGCRLLRIDSVAGTVKIHTGSTRGPLTLKLAQFRRLSLLRPLKTVPPAPGMAPIPRHGRPRLQLLRVTYRDGQHADIKSIGHTELPIGHFVFSPLNAQGDLLRTFFPRPLVARIEPVDLSATLAKRPLADDGPPEVPAATPAALAADAAIQAASQAAPRAPASPQAPARAVPTTPALRLADPAPPSGPSAASAPHRIEPTLDLADLAPPRTPPQTAPRTTAARTSAATPAPTTTSTPPAADDGDLPPLEFTLEAMAPVAAPSAHDTGRPQAQPAGRPAVPPLPPLPQVAGARAALARPPEHTALPELTEVVLPTTPSTSQQANRPTASAGAGARPAATPVSAPAGKPAAHTATASASGTAAPTPAGGLMALQQATTPEQLLAAVDQQARMPMVRIGEALLALGYISAQKLEQALAAQSRDRSLPLGELLVRRGDVSRADLQTALARKMGYPVVDVNVFPVDNPTALKLPLAAARRLTALPLMMHNGRMVVALEDPSARTVIDEVEFTAQCKVVPVLARAGTLAGAIENVYLRLGKDTIEAPEELRISLQGPEHEDSTDKLLADLEQDGGGQGLDEGPLIEQSDNSLVKLINTMILEARQMGVSDIHIECPPSPQKVRVRFRRDGALRPYLELPPTYRQAMVARLKIMCDLDISERRKPQDGKINFGKFVQGQRCELRVATIPTANGLEDVVLRILAGARALPLDKMDLQPDLLAQLRTAVERPYGMVLCVGPTGSGKTTTLHAALAHINTPERKIWTAEDPVEITQPGLRQVQVNAKIDWTFAKALRAFLRADPDVVMIGEVRDEETAKMAVEASLTGHLVLSTLHTNSAPETVTRLLDMGMDPFSFSDSLLAILAQRLVRRWCKHCVSARPAPDDWVDALVAEYLQAYPDADLRPEPGALRDHWQQQLGQAEHGGRLLQHHADGCNHCGGSGFSGRLGLHELLVVSREMRHLVQTRAPASGLQRQAMLDGMRTLRQDGILKVLAGQTAVEEVRAISNL